MLNRIQRMKEEIYLYFTLKKIRRKNKIKINILYQEKSPKKKYKNNLKIEDLCEKSQFKNLKQRGNEYKCNKNTY